MDPNPQTLKPLAPSEWQVLTCVYDLHSANPIQVSEQLQAKNLRTFSPSTCGVLLARVVSKGYLSVKAEHQARGRPLHIYTPTVPWQTAVRLFFEAFVSSYGLSDERLDFLASVLESRTSAKR